jgi:hypothetical protein
VICLFSDSSASRPCPLVEGFGLGGVWPPHQPTPHLLIPVTAVRQDSNLRTTWSVRQSYKTLPSEEFRLLSHKRMHLCHLFWYHFWYRGYQTKTHPLPRLYPQFCLNSRTSQTDLVVIFEVGMFTNKSQTLRLCAK